MSDFQPSRRVLMNMGVATALASTLPSPARARAPIAASQSPYFYRFMHGEAQVTMVSDGPLPLGDPSAAFLGVSKDEVNKMLTDNFLRTDDAVLEQNSPIVNINGRLVLFDTGMGKVQMFGKKTGRLLTSMREAGIEPAQIDAVVCTHAHVDHIGGLVEGGQPVFPNAQVYITRSDFDFWTDEGKLAGPLKAFVEIARANLLPIRDRLVFIRDEQEILPGIQALAAPGHTVGHTVFMISSAGKQLCFIGDLTHHHVLLTEKPRIEFAYDSDPKQSAASRIRILDTLAANRTPMIAYHFPWPGLGHVSKMGDGFRYFASPMALG